MDIDYCKHLIETNLSLVQKTALQNCHCIGLKSFIINESPRIRLFIADKNCELKKFNLFNPIIPIHAHKYDDSFYQLEGLLVHHIYSPDNNGIVFNKYKYLRLSDSDKKIQKIGYERLGYLGGFAHINELDSKTLHTAQVILNKRKRCSWIVQEGLEDKTFEQVSYHRRLMHRKKLYQQMEDPLMFLDKYFEPLPIYKKDYYFI